jgi:cardiolipin synthase
VDEKWATMGSVNLDYLSLLQNREANIVMTRHDTVQDLKKQFYSDLKNCDEIKPDFWKRIPLHYKIIGYLGRSVKRMI